MVGVFHRVLQFPQEILFLFLIFKSEDGEILNTNSWNPCLVYDEW